MYIYSCHSVFIHTVAEIRFILPAEPVNEGDEANLRIELDKDFSCGQREVFYIQTMDDTATGSAAQDCAVQVWWYQLLFVSSIIECLHSFVVAGEDYNSVNRNFTFEPNKTITTQSVKTIDDATPESHEYFNVMIGVLPGTSNVRPGVGNTAAVQVCDSSSKW